MSAVAKLSMSNDLLNAFCETDYIVDIDDQRLCVCIGQAHPALDAVLGHRPWAIITADNPGARSQGSDNNLARRKALAAEVEQAGLESFASTHRARAADWQDEYGLLLRDPPSGWLHAQARRFGQLAIVHGQPGRPAQLWVYAPLAGASAQCDVVQVNP
jgi:hypothetical protein